jgi:hypothetical protein
VVGCMSRERIVTTIVEAVFHVSGSPFMRESMERSC